MKNMRRSPEHNLPHRPQRSQIGQFHLRNGKQSAENLLAKAIQSQIHKAETKPHQPRQTPSRHTRFRDELFAQLSDSNLYTHPRPPRALESTSDPLAFQPFPPWLRARRSAPAVTSFARGGVIFIEVVMGTR